VHCRSQAHLADPECPDKLPIPLTASTAAATTISNTAAHTEPLPPVRTLLCGEPLPTAIRPGCIACFQTQHPPEAGSSLEITLQCSDDSTVRSSTSSNIRGSDSVLRLYVAQCAQQPLSLEGYPWQGVAPQLRVLPWCTDPAVRACPVWIVVAASKLQQDSQQQQQQQQQQSLHVPAASALSAATGVSSSEAATPTSGASAAGTTAAAADAQGDSSSSAAAAAAEQRAMQLMREHKSAALKFTLGVRALAPPRLVRESTWTAVPFCTSPRAQDIVEVSNGNVQVVDLEHALPHVYMTLRLPSPMLQCATNTAAAAAAASSGTSSSSSGGGSSSSGLMAALTAAKGELQLQAFRDSEPVVRVQVRTVVVIILLLYFAW
jgi:hypothetical protein